MTKDIPHSVHYRVVQMFWQESRKYPLKIVEERFVKTLYGPDQWVMEDPKGMTRTLAVFTSYAAALKYQKILSKFRAIEVYGRNTYGAPRYQTISMHEWAGWLGELNVSKDPECIYCYEEKGDSIHTWLKRQHP